MPQILASDVLKRLELVKEQYFLVSAHREENISNDINFTNLMTSLNRIAEKYNFPIIVSTHPRTRNKIEQYTNKSKSDLPDKALNTLHPLIKFLKPLGFSDYNSLQINAYAVLSDSGTISEESSSMNFRALNIREAHERPEAMEEASVMMVGLKSERILQGLVQLQRQTTGSERNIERVADYSMPNVSEKVVRIILSYTDYIKRVVWSE